MHGVDFTFEEKCFERRSAIVASGEYAVIGAGVEKPAKLCAALPHRLRRTARTKILKIRIETAADAGAIANLLQESFPSPGEAQLTQRLREDGEAVLSLLAEADGHILAYVLFSRMVSPQQMLGLGPVATAKAARKQGLASALIREGLTRARADGWRACFVLGNPAFYERFGFRSDFAATFTSAYAGPHFMAIPLQGPEMPVRTGVAAYAKGFMEM